MGTVPTPWSPVAGDDATAARLLTFADALAYLLGSVTSGGSRRGSAEVTQSISQAIPDSAWTDVTFNAESLDYDNSHSTVTNTARFTAQTAGWYQFSGSVGFQSSGAGSRRGTQWAVNGAIVDGSQAMVPTVAAALKVPATTMKIYLNAGDYVTLQAWQDSGANLNTSTTAGNKSALSVEWRHL
jgi:hypothetical protein